MGVTVQYNVNNDSLVEKSRVMLCRANIYGKLPSRIVSFLTGHHGPLITLLIVCSRIRADLINGIGADCRAWDSTEKMTIKMGYILL